MGAGGVIASGLKGGPAFGSGIRYNWSSYGIDASVFDFILTKHGPSFDNPAGPWIKISLFGYGDPFGQSSVYYGAGIGWGTTQANIDGVPFSNFGMDIGLTAGLELHRPARCDTSSSSTLTYLLTQRTAWSQDTRALRPLHPRVALVPLVQPSLGMRASVLRGSSPVHRAAGSSRSRGSAKRFGKRGDRRMRCSLERG